MQLYSVQLIPGKAEITEDKGMYRKASGGLGGPQTPALLHTVHVLITFWSTLWMLEFQLRSRAVDLFFL